MDRFGDLLLGRTHLLRACEVGDRSRFAVVGQDERQVHQFLGFSIQRALGVRLLEVFNVVVVAREVTWLAIRHDVFSFDRFLNLVTQSSQQGTHQGGFISAIAKRPWECGDGGINRGNGGILRAKRRQRFSPMETRDCTQPPATAKTVWSLGPMRAWAVVR